MDHTKNLDGLITENQLKNQQIDQLQQELASLRSALAANAPNEEKSKT